MRLSPRTFAPLFAAAGLGLSSAAMAATVTFASSDGTGRSACAIFTSSGTTLTLVLKNTATASAADPAAVLTGAFFNATGTIGGPATVTGSFVDVVSHVITSNQNLGREWAFRNDMTSPAPGKFGVSAAGLNLFGPNDEIDKNGTNFHGPNNIGGVDFGIIPDGQIGGNGGITNAGQLFTLNPLTFTFTIPSNFDVKSIGGVTFQYGTALNEPRLVGSAVVPTVPAPAAAWGGVALLLGAGLFLRRRPVQIA